MDIKEKIVSGSLKLFTNYGIRSITMDMIAEQLGISKRTIYENFKDKDELLKSCIEAGMITQKAIAEEIMNNSENVIDSTIKFMRYHVNMLKTVNPAFFRDIKKYYQEINEKTIDCSDKHNISKLIDLLDKGILENLFRVQINKEIVANLIYEQFKLIGNQEVFPEEKYPLADVFENLVINFLRGIATEKGLLLIDKYSNDKYKPY